MKRIVLKRLWNKLASVRDYVVKDCVTSHTDLQIIVGTKHMTIASTDLERRAFQAHHTKCRSKFSTNTYELIDFMFLEDPS